MFLFNYIIIEIGSEVKNYSDEASLLVKKWDAFLKLLNSET